MILARQADIVYCYWSNKIDGSHLAFLRSQGLRLEGPKSVTKRCPTMSNSTVEQELWNIFTFYTLHGNPMYPDLLKASQFVKLSRECNIIKSKGGSTGVTQADVNVVYIIEVKETRSWLCKKPGANDIQRFLNR